MDPNILCNPIDRVPCEILGSHHFVESHKQEYLDKKAEL